MGRRFARSDEEWTPFLRSPARRLEQLLAWPETASCPRWRLIEAWTVAAHGPYMAIAGGFRLAFWSEDPAHHGPRLNSDYPPQQAAGKAMYAAAKQAERLAERDERLRAGRHPGSADGRYRAACTYAERWGLQTPPGRWPAG